MGGLTTTDRRWVAGEGVMGPRGVWEGGLGPTTVTVIEVEEVTPETPVAEKVTTVVPIGKVEPLGIELLTLMLGLATSVAVGGVKWTTAPARLVLVTDCDGGVLCRAGVSFTVTVKAALEMLPEWSAAVQLTTVSPIGKVEPLGFE
jgi:hypothetical protein